MSTKHYETTKESLIEEIKRRQEDKIIEKSNDDLLIKLIDKADDLNEAINIATLGTTYKRTGFHFDKRLEKMDRDIKYFKKNEELSFSDGSDKPANKLIVGDNYEALQNLLIEYKGKVDVIYIDPPYGKDSMGEFAHTNYDNAITRDNLLSMLYSRLVLAKELLSDTGVIFCSIDDKNQAYVKCLMDEIYNENNFVGCAPRKTCDIIRKTSDSELQAIFDYVLIYKMDLSVFRKEVTNKKNFPFEDENGKYYLSDFQNSGPNSTRRARPNEYYPIYVNIDGTITLDKKDEQSKEIWPKPSGGEDGRWLWSKEKFIKDNKLLFFDGNTIKKKRYETEFLDDNVYQSYKLWLDDNKFKNNQGTNMVTSILKQGLFDNPKPVSLIKWLINLHINKNCTVVDFFAGSGTTGQAILELNKEDGGERRFVLVQLDENLDDAIKSNPKSTVIPNQIKLCDELNRPHKLSEITAERLRRVMTGKSLTGKTDFEWLKKNEPYGGTLEVYNIERIADTSDIKGRMPFDVIDETLYGQKKFENVNDKIKWVCENFEHTEKYIESEEEYVTRSHRPTK